MSAATSRGFSLVEVLVSMVLLGAVTGSVTAAAISAVRTADRSRERARQEGMLREVAAVVEQELADVSPARDVGAAAADSIRYRAGRGSGYTCGVDAGAIAVRDADYRAWRLPDPARDSLLILLPVDSLAGPAHWVVTPLLAVPGRGHCRDGAPALRFSIDSQLVPRASVHDLPIRVAEWMRIRLYESSGAWWVGAGSLRPGDVIQPIAGPLSAGGLSFAWLGSDGIPVVPAGALLLELRLAAPAAPPGPGRGHLPDTLRTMIAFRNAAP